jgi:hypothetical protein
MLDFVIERLAVASGWHKAEWRLREGGSERIVARNFLRIFRIAGGVVIHLRRPK